MKVSNSNFGILTSMAFAVLAFAMTSESNATTTRTHINAQHARVLLEHAAELNCASDEMRDEIKTHFRKARYYGKMVGTNAQIRGRSAAVVRRLKRDPNYRGLCRDVKKLHELTCELESLYKEAILRARQGKDRPIFEDTCHVAAQVRAMHEMADCMLAISKGEFVLVGEIFVEPTIEAPSYPGVWDRRGNSILDR
ncbi:MAG: hypothetical protein AB8B55_08070 [Mariniblastus sp.]